MIITNNTITEATLSSFDPDAQAFFTAAGITDSIQQFSVDSLVKSLKDQLIWDDLHAIYPFVGGNAISHKYNLKNPADSDAAFRLTFINSPLHSVSGVHFNGTNQYINSNLQPTPTFGSFGDYSIGYYTSVEPTSTGGIPFATTNDTFGQAIQLYITDSFWSLDTWGEDVRLSNSGSFNFKGLIWANYGSYLSNKNRFYVDDVVISESNTTPSRSTDITQPLYFAARNNNGTADVFLNTILNFVFVGKNLAPKASEFNLIIQTFMSNLNRNI